MVLIVMGINRRTADSRDKPAESERNPWRLFDTDQSGRILLSVVRFIDIRCLAEEGFGYGPLSCRVRRKKNDGFFMPFFPMILRRKER